MSENDSTQGRRERLELEQLLKALPRVEASEDFTERVVAASGRHESSWLETLSKVAAVAALCGAAMFAGWWWTGEKGAPSDAGTVADAKALEVEQLQERMQTLQAELEELRRLARDAQPIVPLGSSELGPHHVAPGTADVHVTGDVVPERHHVERAARPAAPAETLVRAAPTRSTSARERAAPRRRPPGARRKIRSTS